MTIDELRALVNKECETRHAKPRHIESQLQQACKRWFDYQYPHLHDLYFAVPNGGTRGKREAAIMKQEGVVAGVAGTLLLLPRHGYGCLCIEFKTSIGKQSDRQKAWQISTQNAGNKYVIVRTIEEFIDVVNEYIR